MNLQDYIALPEDEKPFDRMPDDGGFCAVFRSIACIGDSLSSGEFEALTKDGQRSYHDMYDYSWGQYIARDCGCKVYNFSRGGMTASEYVDSFAEANGFWGEDKLCQAYIIALGVNDLINAGQPIGSIDDLHEDWRENPANFAGYYGKIIGRIREMRPDAYFFLMTMPRAAYEPNERKEAHAALLHEIAAKIPRTYVLDFYRHAPCHDADFCRRFYVGGHMNPAGYLLTAKMVESYIDFLVRHHPEEFAQVGFIGTPHYYHKN